MPSFSLLLEEEKEQLISYVIHLSLRGEVELNTMKALLNKEDLGGSISEKVQSDLGTFLGYWAESDGKVLDPAPTFVISTTEISCAARSAAVTNCSPT